MRSSLLRLSTLALAACSATNRAGEATLELDGAWVRTFGADADAAYEAILAVLAEKDWSVERRNPPGGSISAKSPVRTRRVPGFGDLLHYTLARFDLENAAPGLTRVRLVLTDTREAAGRGRQPNNDRPVRERAAYEELFRLIQARLDS